MKKTPNQIIYERSELVDKIISHLNDWNEMKQKQSGRDSNFRYAELFNILDLLDRETIRQMINLYNEMRDY